MDDAVASPLKLLLTRVQRLRDWLKSPAGKRLTNAAGIAMSLIILSALAEAVNEVGWGAMLAVLPRRPLFWGLLLASYFLQPLIDWEIFRHWWRLGIGHIAIFLKRRVLNEAAFSYAGDAWLLVWAADRMGIVYDPKAPPPPIARGDGPGVNPADSPFAAVKDVAVTSGLAGNLVTLIMLLLAIALGGHTNLDTNIDGSTLRRIIFGFSALILLSVTIVVNRNKVLSLSPRENWRLFSLHLVRALGSHMLLVATWLVALPAIAFSTWMVLGALRMIITRMPVPNKELLFAALAVELTGEASASVAALMAAQGVLYLACHGLAWLLAMAVGRNAD